MLTHCEGEGLWVQTLGLCKGCFWLYILIINIQDTLVLGLSLQVVDMSPSLKDRPFPLTSCCADNRVKGTN